MGTPLKMIPIIEEDSSRLCWGSDSYTENHLLNEEPFLFTASLQDSSQPFRGRDGTFFPPLDLRWMIPSFSVLQGTHSLQVMNHVFCCQQHFCQ